MLNPDTWKIVTSLIFSDKHLPGLSTEASVFHLKFACHVESTPVQINNMKKHTKKKHLRRASNNKCRMLITSLREEKMAQQCEPSSDWSFVCGKSVEGKKSVRYVHMYTIYKPGTQYRIEITTIQVAMWLQRGHNNTHSECRYTMDTMGTQRGGWSRWRRTIYGEARHRQMRRTLAYLIIGRSWVATKSL